MLTARQSAEVRLLRINSSVKLDAWSIHRMTGFDIADIIKFLEAEELPKPTYDSLRKLKLRFEEGRREDLADCPPGRDPAEHRRIVEAVYGV